MKVDRVSKVIEGFAKSKPGEKFYTWACNPKNETFLNNTLPQVETVLSTACYVWSTARQKNIDKEQKDLLQIQNIGSGVVGLALSTAVNKKVGKYTEEIIKDLDKAKIDPKSVRKISAGIRIGTPILITASIMRFALPSVLACFSGKMMDKKREKKDSHKIDYKA